MTTTDHPDDLLQYPYRHSELTPDQRLLWLCQNRPVFPLPQDDAGVVTWLVTGWDELRKVLSDQETYSRAKAVGRGDYDRPEGQYLIDMDGAEHRRLRQAVQPAFSPKRAAALRPRAQRLVDELIDRMAEGGGPVDLVESLALPLPITIISDILGVPAEDAPRFIGWSEAFLSTAQDPAEAIAAAGSLTAYMAGLVEQRRARPANDLLSELVHGEEPITDADELLNLVTLILVAGYETTATMITNIMFTLLTREGLFDRVRQALADPVAAPAAVEELLRVVPIGGVDAQPRVATRDTMLGGERIGEGDTVRVVMEAGNYDPARFRCPHRVDLGRDNGPHLSFGHGVHMCLGAHLARMEVEVAVGTLTRRLPGLRLAVPADQVPSKASMSIRGPRELLVALS